MSTLEQAARQALEALIWTTGSTDFGKFGHAHEGALKLLFPAITALRQALEQKKQEQYTYTSTQATTCAECGKHKHTPLRIDAMGGYVCLTCIDKKLGSLLGEFGHSGQPKQEPVAWHYQSRLGNAYVTDVKAEPSPDWRETPLYTEPPAREWQGLTDEDIRQGFQDSWVTEQAWQSAVWWAEEKLKEKNTHEARR